jgi:cytosine/uracil/thiamine/allantoin permease
LMCSISFWLDDLELGCLIDHFPLNFNSNALLNILVSSSFLHGEVKKIISAKCFLTTFIFVLYFCFWFYTFLFFPQHFKKISYLLLGCCSCFYWWLLQLDIYKVYDSSSNYIWGQMCRSWCLSCKHCLLDRCHVRVDMSL